MATVAPLTSYTYAAGTCALRLTGQVSPLSELADRTVLRRSRFQLQLWEEADFDLESATVEQSAPGSGQPPVFEVSGREPQLTALTTLVQRYVHTYLQGATLTPAQGLSQGDLSLAPVGLTRHRLTIAGAEVPQAVNLSMLQLADLAEVLTQAEQAVDHLPEAMVASVRRRSRLPLWMGSVAAVLVAAVLGSQWLIPGPTFRIQTIPETAGSAPDREAADSLAGTPPEDGTETAERVLPGDSPLAEAEPLPGTALPPSDLGESPTDSIAVAPAAPAAPPSTPPLQPKISRNARPAPDPAPSAPMPPPNVAAAPPDIQAERNGDALGDSGPTDQTARVESLPEAADSPTTAAEMAPSPMAATAAPEEEAWVEALRTTIQASWTPIPGITTPLQYRMTLAANGQVLALEPLNAPSRQYLDSETLPQVGTTVPNIVPSQPATVEIQLLPSGEVLVLP